jgi:hypothetical protein
MQFNAFAKFKTSILRHYDTIFYKSLNVLNEVAIIKNVDVIFSYI